MNLGLNNRKALVCGASEGIGAGIAEALAEEGVILALVSRSEEKLQKLADRLPGEHVIFTADFASSDEVARLVDFVGTAEIDILINNTGGPPPGPVLDANIDDFNRALQMHLYTSHSLTNAVLPAMRSRGYGRIINVISTSVKMPISGLGVSNTTRGAMASWSKTLSMEVAKDGITVNNILPGAVDTRRLAGVIRSQAEKAGISEKEATEKMLDSIPAGRFGDPKELGNLAAFLASEKAAYITGVSIQVDGGRTKAF